MIGKVTAEAGCPVCPMEALQFGVTRLDGVGFMLHQPYANCL